MLLYPVEEHYAVGTEFKPHWCLSRKHISRLSCEWVPMSNQDNNHGWVHYWLEWRALTRPDSIWLLHQTLQSMLHLVLNMRKYLPPHLQRLVPLNHDKCIGVDMSQEFKLFKCSFNRSFPNLTPRDEGMACIIGEGWAKDWRKGRRSSGESNPSQLIC